MMRFQRRTTRPGREIEQTGALPRHPEATLTAQFRPLDASIINETIPAFFIGRNMEGFWVARDAKGQIGGIFLLEKSAVSFARENNAPRGCATVFPSERFELDLENRGNPLVGPIGSLIRLVHQSQDLLAIFMGETRKAIGRLQRKLHVR